MLPWPVHRPRQNDQALGELVSTSAKCNGLFISFSLKKVNGNCKATNWVEKLHPLLFEGFWLCLKNLLAFPPPQYTNGLLKNARSLVAFFWREITWRSPMDEIDVNAKAQLQLGRAAIFGHVQSEFYVHNRQENSQV